MKFLELLLSTTERRQLDMITRLVGTHQAVPCSDLLKEFSISEAILRDTLKERFPGMRLIIYKNTVDMRLPVDHNSQDIYRLFLLQLEKDLILHLNETLRDIQVLIISRNNVKHSRMVKNYISLNFSDRIKTTVYEEMVIDLEKIKKMDIDIIASNFHIPPIEGKIMCATEDLPSFMDYANFSHLIHKLIFGDDPLVTKDEEKDKE